MFLTNNSQSSRLTLKSLLFTLLVMCVFPFALSANSAHQNLSQLKEEHNFQQLATLMKAKKLPLLIEFHADSCPYCKQLEEDFLSLMVGTPEYDNKIIIRQLKLDSGGDVIDFNGNTVSAHDFATRYKAYMTPVMIFVNASGDEVAERIVGINTPSLFGAYIDAEIDKALKKVRAQ